MRLALPDPSRARSLARRVFVRLQRVLPLFALCLSLPAYGAPSTVTPPNGSTTNALPILMYDTDVGVGYGAKLFLLNHLGAAESFDVTLFNGTRGKRWYRFVFSQPDPELRQRKRYPIAVDLLADFDKDIKRSFFGVGADSLFDDREYYTREPFDADVTLSRGFSRAVVGRAGVRYKTVRNLNFSDESRLRTTPPDLNAAQASFASAHVGMRYDSRDSVVHPKRGVLAEAEAEFSPRSALSDVAFTRLATTLQRYSVLWHPATVLACRLKVQSLLGSSLPVQVLLPMGGGTTLRGSPQDRFLGKVSAVSNVELRLPVVGKLGGVVGFDVGKAWSSLAEVDLRNWSANPTVGLRYYLSTFVVRVDVGLGKEATGVYFNFGQVY